MSDIRSTSPQAGNCRESISSPGPLENREEVHESVQDQQHDREDIQPAEQEGAVDEKVVREQQTGGDEGSVTGRFIWIQFIAFGPVNV
ncbi:hypothetical protein VKT23_019757 [Stygiomarasmius scandens]|uniref:Uncharacterized protein n=1 Tax=Marasmiellus scandens TaxID=2682957 RepID=A0ABR1IKF9_9AGAR